MSDSGTWEKERALVMQEIKDLKRDHTAVMRKLDSMQKQQSDDSKAVAVEVAKLQVKSTVWGGLSGLLTAAVALALQALGKG